MDKLQPPVAARIPTTLKLGRIAGEERGEGAMDPPIDWIDPYYWLRDDTRKNEKVLSYLREENKYTASLMDPHKKLEDELYQEMKSRMQETEDSFPYPMGEGGEHSEYLYFSRTVEGKAHTIYCRRRHRRPDSKLATKSVLGSKSEAKASQQKEEEEVLLDVNELASKAGSSHFDVSKPRTSPNHQFLAYGIDSRGDEKYDVVILDLKTRGLLPFKLPGVPFANFLWGPKRDRLYYTTCDKSERLDRIWSLGLTEQFEDAALLFEEKDIGYSVGGMEVSEDDSMLLFSITCYDADEVHYLELDAASPTKQPQLIHPRTPGLKYDVIKHDKNFIIRTNKDDAKNFKLMIAAIPQVPFWLPQAGEGVVPAGVWKDLRAYRSDEYITGIQAFQNHLAVALRKNGFPTVAVIACRPDGSYSPTWDYLSFPGTLGAAYPVDNYVYDTNLLRIRLESFTHPSTLLQYQMGGVIQGEDPMKTLYRKPIPNYDPSLYTSTLLWAPSHDKVQVPISFVTKRASAAAAEPPKPRRLHLYGYGSYGHCVDPSFSSSVASLIDRGCDYAVAHIRGGAELGYEWYLDGKMHTKMNTFLDFIACADFLIRQGYTTPSLLSIEGRSAGGLLAGAVMTMRPDICKKVVAVVPFVDVVATMADPTIPLTVEEWTQWGNTNKQGDLAYMRQYSPIDNLRPGVDYPNSLFLGGLNDPRVGYWEPAKFVAKLRHVQQSVAEIDSKQGPCPAGGGAEHLNKRRHLLKTEMNSGHFGTADRYKYLRESAFILSFLLQDAT